MREESVFLSFFRLVFHPVHQVLCLLGSQSYLGCCYLWTEPFFFFTRALWLLGSQSSLGCCYMKADVFQWKELYSCCDDQTIRTESTPFSKCTFCWLTFWYFFRRCCFWPSGVCPLFSWVFYLILIIDLIMKLPTSKILLLVAYSIAFTFPTPLSTVITSLA